MSVRGRRPGEPAALFLTCPDRVSRYGARRRRTQQAGAAPYGLVAALLKANTKRVWYSKYLGFPLKRKRHSLQRHTLIWSSSLARLAAAAAMATLTAAALVAVTLVAAAAPGQQRELSLQCWRQLAAAAGGGGWRRHCWRQPCGGGAAVAARRRRCSALPQQARPDSTGSLPARPAHSNAPAAPADCWMATVANVGEVVRRRDQLIRRRRSLDHGRRRRLTRVHGRIQQACSPPAL